MQPLEDPPVQIIREVIEPQALKDVSGFINKFFTFLLCFSPKSNVELVWIIKEKKKIFFFSLHLDFSKFTIEMFNIFMIP